MRDMFEFDVFGSKFDVFGSMRVLQQFLFLEVS